MKTPMTAGRWWEEVGCSKYAHTDASTEDIARMAFVAGQANSPQPQWHRWSESKPIVENEWGAKEILCENLPVHLCSPFNIRNIEGSLHYSDNIVAWQYILPSGFAPKQKDEASIAFQEWVNKKCEGVTMIPDPTVKESRVGNVTEDVFTEIYNLGRAKAKQ